MDSISKVQLADKCHDIRKAQKKLQNSKNKDKMNNSKSNSKLKKHTSMLYMDDEKDKDVILRMVLPGYNWFEDQVKNNIYTTEGEKKKIPGNVSTNPKLKMSNNKEILPGPVIHQNIESLLKQKSVLSKRVINSTLMLLPNNSLPLKKRKIKEEMKNLEFLEVISSDDMEIEIKNSNFSQSRESKKLYNPPIQKVIPILNNNKSIDEITVKIKEHENVRLSAFKSEHLQKNHSCISKHYQNSNNSPNTYIPINALEYSLQHSSMMNKPVTYPVPKIKSKFQPPYQSNSNFCHQCNAMRYQTSHYNKQNKHDCSKLVVNFPCTQSMLPQKSYWPSNNYQMYSSYDTLAIPETSQIYSQTHQSIKPFENFVGYGTCEKPNQIETMPLSYTNGNTQAYCQNTYWNKQNMTQYKHVQMNPVRNEFRNSNFINSMNTVPVQHSPHQYFFKGFNPIG